MPIYEFYCATCHTIFSFLSRTSKATKRPACPRCNRPRLERRVSPFAISKGRPEPAADDALPAEVDEARIERTMADLARAAEGMDENDPRQMAHVLRKLFDGTGMPLGDGMAEAIRRLEAGEDPDKIEEELGDALEADGDLLGSVSGGLKSLRRLRPPDVDATLYEL